MAKKFLLGMMAFATLFATSCTNELDPVEMGNTSTVSFKVGTPAIESRAYSDGATATVLQYAVYDANGNYLSDLTETDATINGSTTVKLQLTTGNTYSVIFWAAAPNAPYTVDFAAKEMTVDYTNAVSNDEKRDAFYKHHTFTVTGAQTETIELKRPFAQLNIGTADFAKSKSAGYVPIYSSVKVSNVYTTLNLVNGDVSIPTTDVTFAPGVIPTAFDATENKFTGEKFPVDGYDYLAMNYLLVGADKGTVDIEFTYGTSVDDPDAKTRTVGSVPVQRNYRTNIYGQLLTSDVDINVEIKPEYDGALELDDLHKAALNGGEYTLTEDIVLTAPLEVKSNLTLNLNGKTISGNHHKSIGAIITNSGTLTITGGTITSAGYNGGSAVQNNGTMIIKGTTLNGAPNANGSWPSYTVNNTGTLTLNNSTITSYHGAVASYGNNAVVTLNNSVIDMTGIEGFTSHGIYTYDNGKVIVNGGTYENKATDQNSSGASVINGAVEVIAGNFSGRIENYYGTPVLKGGSYSVKPKTTFVAAGYTVFVTNGVYHILPTVVAEAAIAENVTAVTESTADVATALANDNNKATMFMWNDVAYIAKYGEVVITSAADEATTVRSVVENATALTKATVAEGIKVVGNRTFRKCANLVTVELPNTLTEIGPAVFQSCSKLANVTIPKSVTTIGEGAFAECTSLTSINIPDGITRLEKDVLRNTGLTSIEIPASVNYIGTYAFRDCKSLTEVKILSTEFTIENNTFTNVAAPVPTMTIYVVNAEMKDYLDSILTDYDQSYITVTVKN